MEEEDFDSTSPIGQLIQKINKLVKKPQIDDQLNNALEKFQEKITCQKAYLKNGIFNINFAEAALFLQSCAELYGKKIDLFWDQLLEFHTRLIEYDCRDEQEKGKKINKEVVQKLEERRNRYKRKKKFKLVLPEETTNVDDFLFDKAEDEEQTPVTFEADDELYKAWRRIEWESSEITKVPRAIVKQQRRMYRMKNYYIMKSQDWDIYDSEDNEFNTKYSRIPGWHVIHHIFEYNTLGLLPDKNNTIATLRLCCYLRAQFMRDRKIPFNAPYSQYKEEYLAYKKQFFEEEAKKWQNMPLDTMADLRRQLDYLAQKEREEQGDIPKNRLDIPPFLHKKGCEYEGCTDCSEDSKSSIISISESDKDSDDGFFKDTAKTEISTGIVDHKHRQDSGFFELSESDASLLSDTSKVDNITENVAHTQDSSKNTTENVQPVQTETDNNNDLLESDKTNEAMETVEANANSTDPTIISEVDPKETTENENVIQTSVDPTKISEKETTENENVIETTVDPTKISEKETTENGNVIETTVDPTKISEKETTENGNVIETSVDPTKISEKETTENENVIQTSVDSSEIEHTENSNEVSLETNKTNSTSTDLTSKISENTTQPSGECSDENDNCDTRSIMSEHNYCNDTHDNDDARSVRSDHDYCSQTEQINVLNKKNLKQNMVPMNTKSTIIPKIASTKVPKENKRTLLGPPPPPKRRKLSKQQIEKLMTSKITPVKEMKFEKFFSMNYQPQLGEGDIETIDYESDNEVTPEAVLAPDDDVRSIVSEHSYCHLDNQLPTDESGFFDEVDSQENENPSMEGNQEASFHNEETPSESRLPEEEPPRVDPEYQAEYKRLLAQLRDSRRELGEELRINPEQDTITDRQRKEQERLATKARVEQWKETITPILRNLKENDFDIHEYGTRVMEGMELEETKPFKNIVDGKPSAEVVRYFIASLQLANTYNIEICGAKKGELSNDTFNVKLLKKDRYHEHLSEYHAPSEDDFRKKIKRLRDIQRREMDEEQENEPVTSKRQRNEYSNKRKRQSQDTTSPSSSDNDTSHTVKRSKSNSINPPNPIKGKNIVVRIVPMADINSPSTSRSDFVSSPSSNEERFCEELASVQSKNPERFSTPATPRQNRHLKPVISNVKLVFE